MTARRTLVIAPPPSIFGGIAAQTLLLADHLARSGHAVTLAHYATLGAEPELTGSLPRLLAGGRPTVRRYRDGRGRNLVSVGCWLPELEVTYYRSSRFWRALVAAHDRHLAVGGNVLTATTLVAAGVPHLIWCASDVLADRADRQRAMPAWRRAYDRLVVAPRLLAMERRVLGGGGRIMAISAYTERRLRRLSPDRGRPIVRVPVPVDTERLRPPAKPPRPGVVGIAGRHSDPRKNAGLALEAVARARAQGADVTIIVAGQAPPSLVERARRLGLDAAARFVGVLSTEALADFYRGLDAFVIPSLQEGLNICGLEASACGVPVISTRCGGPESYVSHGETGFLTGFEAREIARRIVEIAADRGLRRRLSANARAVAETEYGPDRFARRLDKEWRATWGEAVAP